MKRQLLAGIFVVAMGLGLGFGAAEARADACLGGGSHNYKDDASTKDLATNTSSPGTRQLGFGLLAAASVSTAWLSFRRRDPDDRKK
jgi:hypothetical protein